jgi:hypothetical protein
VTLGWVTFYRVRQRSRHLRGNIFSAADKDSLRARNVAGIDAGGERPTAWFL